MDAVFLLLASEGNHAKPLQQVSARALREFGCCRGWRVAGGCCAGRSRNITGYRSAGRGLAPAKPLLKLLGRGRIGSSDVAVGWCEAGGGCAGSFLRCWLLLLLPEFFFLFYSLL